MGITFIDLLIINLTKDTLRLWLIRGLVSQGPPQDLLGQSLPFPLPL